MNAHPFFLASVNIQKKIDLLPSMISLSLPELFGLSSCLASLKPSKLTICVEINIIRFQQYLFLLTMWMHYPSKPVFLGHFNHELVKPLQVHLPFVSQTSTHFFTYKHDERITIVTKPANPTRTAVSTNSSSSS